MLKNGDPVRARGMHEVMHIETLLPDEQARCVWKDKEGKPQELVYPLAALELVPERPRGPLPTHATGQRRPRLGMIA